MSTKASSRWNHLNRRRFLRGLGACVALPAMESLNPFSVLAGPTIDNGQSVAAPVRMAFVYVPNGIIPAGWWPEGDGGANFQLSDTLQPLQSVRDKITLISGLEDLS